MEDESGILRRAHECIAVWRAHPEAPVLCPRCGRNGLKIVDQSARPYAEWYALSCGSCGFEQTLQIPLAPPFGND